jgi:hypothetical protein
MEKRNVETWFCTSDGHVTRFSSCNPGVCTDNLNAGVAVMKSTQDGA